VRSPMRAKLKSLGAEAAARGAARRGKRWRREIDNISEISGTDSH